MEIPIKVYRENSNVEFPFYATEDSACADVYVHRLDIHNDIVVVHTGLHFALPTGWEMQIRPRSGFTKYRYAVLNSPGTLDADYRGELLIKYTRIDGGYADDFPYNIGDRCCQINIHPVPKMKFEEVDSLEALGETERGQGGFNSTGKN